MPYYFIPCRSLTYAQRSAKVLERVGITSYMARTPKSIAREGCGHGLKINEKHIKLSLSTLEKADLSPKYLYHSDEDGSLHEVAL